MSGYTVKLRGAPPAVSTRDYLCDQCGRFELLVDNPPPDAIDCPACGTISQRVVSAPAVHTMFVVSATQGKPEPKPHRMALDTRSLGEGQSHAEWRAQRRAAWREHDRRARKEARE